MDSEFCTNDFRVVYENNKANVFKTALMICGNIQSAEYIAQDVFVRLYPKLGQIKTPEAFNLWLYRIIVNCAIDFNKRNMKYVISENNDFAGDLKETNVLDLPEDNVLGKELYSKISLAIYELPVHYRISIILYFYKDLSIKEIAKVTSSFEGTVKSRLFNGKKY